jgi:uncharacterized protein (DUF2141 family)
MKPSRLAIAATLAALAGTARAADLTVEVSGVAGPQGKVAVGAYDNAKSWLNKPVKSVRVEAAAGTVTAVIPDLPEGVYAVIAYHDENGNERLDSNMLKIPTEPFGFSNNRMGMFGPPSFEDSSFKLPREGTRIAIKLKN